MNLICLMDFNTHCDHCKCLLPKQAFLTQCKYGEVPLGFATITI